MPEEPEKFSRTAEELIASFRGVPLDNPAYMRKRATKDLGPLIEDLLVKYQIGRDSPEHTIREHWAEIVGSANASYSHPVRLESNRSLVVLASHAVVRNELFHHRALIVDKIRKLPGCNEIRSINLRSG